MSDLATINKTLLKQNKLLKESVGGSATAVAKAAEDKAEGKTYDTEVLSTLKSIRDALGGSAGGGGAGKDGAKKGGLIAGMIRGLGGLAGGIIKMVSKIGVGFIKGMGSLALGIGAFMLGLGGAAKIAELVGFKGDSLKALVSNVFGAFSGTDLVVMAAIIGAAMGMEKFKISKVGVMLGMGAIGGGIAAFILGILAAEGFAKIGDLLALDGKSLATLMTNVFGAFKGIPMGGLTALLIGGVAVGMVPGGKRAIMTGMAAIGAGIAAFTLGILAAEGFASLGALIGLSGANLNKLLSNFWEAFEGVGIPGLITLLTAGALAGAIPGGEIAVVKGMTAIGAGIAGFSIGLLAADAIASIGKMMGMDGSSLKGLLTNLGEGLGGFFGGIGKGIFEQLKDVDGKKMKELGAGIAGIGVGIAAFAIGGALGVIGGVMEGLGSFFGIKSPIQKIIEISQDSSIDTKRLKELGEGIGPLGQGLAGFSGLDFGGGLFGGDSLDDFIKMIARLGGSKLSINADRLKEIGDAIKPLGVAIGAFGDVKVANLKGLKGFFGEIQTHNMRNVAEPEELARVAAGIKPLAEALATFGSLDLDKITGGWGEDNLGKFFTGIGKAADKVKKPEALKAIGQGIADLAKGLKTFANIDGDRLAGNIAAYNQLTFTPQTKVRLARFAQLDPIVAQENKTVDFANKSAMNAGGGTVVVNNDNSVTNNDYNNSTISQTSVAAKIDATGKDEKYL